MSIDWDFAVFLLPFAALAASLAALFFGIAMHHRVKKIFRSANVPDIERLLRLHTKTLEEFVRFKAESSLYMSSLDNRIKEKMRSAPILRFNPFNHGGEAGGNQSFSSVFADERGDGVVITSMHTRERTNVFAKPLNEWKSEYELSEEEKEAVRKSKNNEPKK